MVVLDSLCMGCMEEKGDLDQCPACGFAEAEVQESSNHLQPRTILQDKYIIGRALGQGGFAITYLAWDINLGIKLAIKEYFPLDLVYRVPGNNLVVAHSKAQDKIFAHDMDKFLQEARVLARFMDHPNIVSVTDFFQANRTAYLVMHYIEGATLRHHITRAGEKIPFTVALEIMMPVMDALRVIHEAGLLHRDISPENIFINNSGRVVLIDFGAVRRSAGGEGDSISVVMKPGYTPEEQYRSKGLQGPATDIYAVAATIYRATTGQMPPNALDRLEDDTLIPPSQLGVQIHQAQEEALLKALSVHAPQRFQTVTEFQRALIQKKKIASDKEKASTELKQLEATDNQKTTMLRQEKTERLSSSPVPQANQPEAQPVTKPVEQPAQKAEKSFTSLGDVNIGRSADNDLVLEGNTVSRYHARIISRYGKWYIADLDSTHGTYINDKKIEELFELTSNSSIRLGENVIYYDGNNLISENGVVLHTLNEHVSFTERWLAGDRVSATQIIENFFASLTKRSTPSEDSVPARNVSIGRAADNDLVLDNDMVSRYHASLFQHSGNWYIADLQSTHGTKVNDVAVSEPVQLGDTDIISMSDINLVYIGNSIRNENDEIIYQLPEEKLYPNGYDQTGEMLSSNLWDTLISDRLWVILVLTFGLVGIVAIIAMLLMTGLN